MSYESFNIRPGMSCWVDMPESYKDAYYEKFPLAKFGDGTPVQWRSEPEVEPNQISDEPDWRSPITLDEPIIELEDEIENTCPACGNELPTGKKYCTRQCFYDRNK